MSFFKKEKYQDPSFPPLLDNEIEFIKKLDVDSATRFIETHGKNKSADAKEHIREANQFEFDICNLLLKGAGAAFTLYFALIAYLKITPSFVPLILWATSAYLGMLHQKKWSRRLLGIGKRENLISMEAALQIFKHNDDRCKFVMQVLKEQFLYLSRITAKQRLNQADYKYVVVFTELPFFLINLQIILVILGIFIAATQLFPNSVSLNVAS